MISNYATILNRRVRNVVVVVTNVISIRRVNIYIYVHYRTIYVVRLTCIFDENVWRIGPNRERVEPWLLC